MRQSAADILRRWMALDKHLYRGRVRLSVFARGWKVDVKTLRRDLATFKRLGYVAVLREVVPGEEYGWSYPRGRQPMFTASRWPPQKPPVQQRSTLFD
jgi:hypothetical protein